MKLTAKEARDAVYDSHEDWKTVPYTEMIIDNSRWSIHKQAILKHIPTNKHYLFQWSIGATEQQDEQAYEYDKEVEVVEVRQKEVTKLEWVVFSEKTGWLG